MQFFTSFFYGFNFYLAGIIKDAMGSYDPIILVINLITLLTVAMWTVEMVIRKVKRKNKRRLAEESAKASQAASAGREMAPLSKQPS